MGVAHSKDRITEQMMLASFVFLGLADAQEAEVGVALWPPSDGYP